MPVVRPRRAVTLIEFVVVVAVLAVVVGLLLVAVQSARQTAAKVEAFNGARQLLLATHAYAANNRDHLMADDGQPDWMGGSVIRYLCPYLEGQPQSPPKFLRLKSDPSAPLPSQMPIGPAGGNFVILPCSFAFNATCYTPTYRLNRTITDGLSNTIGLSEHYGVCRETTFEMNLSGGGSTVVDGQVIVRTQLDPAFHRATFADYPMYNDVYPVPSTANGQRVTTGSMAFTFQVRPALADCNPRIPQSSLPGGILAGMLDGSVRFLHPHTAPEVFWGGVTPAGGEVVSFD